MRPPTSLSGQLVLQGGLRWRGVYIKSQGEIILSSSILPSRYGSSRVRSSGKSMYHWSFSFIGLAEWLTDRCAAISYAVKGTQTSQGTAIPLPVLQGVCAAVDTLFIPSPPGVLQIKACFHSLLMLQGGRGAHLSACTQGGKPNISNGLCSRGPTHDSR